MILQRHFWKPETVGEYVEIFVRNEEEIILASGTEAPQTGEYDQFLFNETAFYALEKTLDDVMGTIVRNIVAFA